MVSDMDLAEITGLFVYLQLIASGSPATDYDKAEKYRTNTLIAVRKGKNIDYVFVNVPKKEFSPWRKKMWEKRKAKIKLHSFEVGTDNPEIIRLGFK